MEGHPFGWQLVQRSCTPRSRRAQLKRKEDVSLPYCEEKILRSCYSPSPPSTDRRRPQFLCYQGKPLLSITVSTSPICFCAPCETSVYRLVYVHYTTSETSHVLKQWPCITKKVKRRSLTTLRDNNPASKSKRYVRWKQPKQAIIACYSIRRRIERMHDGLRTSRGKNHFSYQAGWLTGRSSHTIQ